MFTGIVEETGKVVEARHGEKSIRLTVEASLAAAGVKLGDSIAVNGCCLTVVEIGGESGHRRIGFDLLVETWNRTNLQYAGPGALVNLERSLAADGRIHGHFVTGHVDGAGVIQLFERRASDWYLRIQAPAEILRYVVFKGSIAVDGISLTVAEAGSDSFSVWIIPHTWEVTALRERTAGDKVNLEADLLAKYAEKFLSRG